MKKFLSYLNILGMVLALISFSYNSYASTNPEKSDMEDCHDAKAQTSKQMNMDDCDCSDDPMHDHSDCGTCHLASVSIYAPHSLSNEVVSMLENSQIISGFRSINLNPRDQLHGLFRPPIFA
jgi:hypothetical protein